MVDAAVETPVGVWIAVVSGSGVEAEAQVWFVKVCLRYDHDRGQLAGKESTLPCGVLVVED